VFGTVADWWGTYHNTHPNVETINWNEFKVHFRTHYVPHGTLKLKKKEFSDLNQGSMMVNEYLNQFIQLSRYATDDISTNKKRQETILKVSMTRSNSSCSTQTTQIFSIWLTRTSTLRISRKRWRRMEYARWVF
jgi:hypothetical protein